MHNLWEKNIMGNNLTESGFPIFEIDESEIIGNSEVIYWMFGIFDRFSKESSVFCILNNKFKINYYKNDQRNNFDN